MSFCGSQIKLSSPVVTGRWVRKDSSGSVCGRGSMICYLRAETMAMCGQTLNAYSGVLGQARAGIGGGARSGTRVARRGHSPIGAESCAKQ